MKNKVVILIIVILLILSGIGIFTYIYLNNKQNNEVEKASNTVSKIDEMNDVWSHIKIDAEKNIVYNANYIYTVEQKEYKSPTGEQHSIHDIVIPYININTEKIKELNNMLETQYKQLAQTFETNLKTDTSLYVKSDYRTYINNNILSILITIMTGNADAQKDEYIAYNINLDTLEILSYEQTYEQCGFTSIDIDNSIKASIELFFDNNGNWSSDEEKSIYMTMCINNYQTEVKDNTIQYFIDLNKKLNVIIEVEIPSIGIYDAVLTIE